MQQKQLYIRVPEFKGSVNAVEAAVHEVLSLRQVNAAEAAVHDLAEFKGGVNAVLAAAESKSFRV